MAEKPKEKTEAEHEEHHKKHHKKVTALKGIGLHLFVYIVIALVLSLLGVPAFVVGLILVVLLWGLLVMSYAFYYKK